MREDCSVYKFVFCFFVFELTARALFEALVLRVMRDCQEIACAYSYRRAYMRCVARLGTRPLIKPLTVTCQVYCSGDSFGLGGSKVFIEGGTFVDNEALELGGAIVAWGLPTVVTITGGLFENNTAK